MDIRDRVKEIIYHNNITISDLEKKLSLSNGTLGKFLNGDTKDIAFKTVLNISAVFPNINPLWLFNGLGEREQNGSDTNNLPQTQEDRSNPPSINMGECIEKVKGLEAIIQVQKDEIEFLRSMLKKEK